MSCDACGTRRAVVQCGNECGAVYCGQPCAKRAWAAHHEFICGKRDRPTDESPCSNEHDPMTMDAFTGMDDNLILRMAGDKCYHLPSLYEWVVNRGNNRDPLTNQAFDADALAMIRDEARNRFPLTVTIGAKKHATTALTDALGLVALVLERPRATLYEFVNHLADNESSYTLQVLGMARRLVEIVDQQEHVLIKDLGLGNDIHIHHSPHVAPLASLFDNLYYLDIARRRKWPTAKFERNIAQLQDAAGRAEFQRELHDNVARRRPVDEQGQQPPNTRRVNVSLNTNDGHAYGVFAVYPPTVRGAVVYLRVLEPLIRTHLQRAGIDVPRNRAMRYVHAGAVYNGDAVLEDDMEALSIVF